jgi:nucleotide-binding universal stress UspA family protein
VVEQLREQAGDILKEQAAKIEQEGGQVAQKHLRIAERYRAQQIVRVAEDIGAGLIVMGSRGLGGVRRALMGSVSDSVVRHAHCPVWWSVPRRNRRRRVARTSETSVKRKFNFVEFSFHALG